MNIELALAEELKTALHDLYQIDIQADASLIQPTRKEFDGDLTIVVRQIMPKSLSKKEKELIEKLRKQENFR